MKTGVKTGVKTATSNNQRGFCLDGVPSTVQHEGQNAPLIAGAALVIGLRSDRGCGSCCGCSSAYKPTQNEARRPSLHGKPVHPGGLVMGCPAQKA